MIDRENGSCAVHDGLWVPARRCAVQRWVRRVSLQQGTSIRCDEAGKLAVASRCAEGNFLGNSAIGELDKTGSDYQARSASKSGGCVLLSAGVP